MEIGILYTSHLAQSFDDTNMHKNTHASTHTCERARCLCFLIRGWKYSWTTVWIPRLQILPRFFWFWSQKPFFLDQNPLRCDFILFRLVGWLVVTCYYFKTGFAADSGHETDIFVRKPPEKAISFLERSMQNLSKTVRKGMFPTGIYGIFLCFFPQFVTHFFRKKSTWRHIFDLEKKLLDPRGEGADPIFDMWK